MCSRSAMDDLSRMRESMAEKGLEVHPFLVGWYNEVVGPQFQLAASSPNTLAGVVVSTPAMFESLFLPYLHTQYRRGELDPLDQCMKTYLEHVSQTLPEADHVQIIQDFEMDEMRRPKVLVQTAGHVSGAAYYYQRSNVVPDAWAGHRKVYGVSVHPRYGGWFALRAVMVFHGALSPLLKKVEPKDCVPTREQRIELLDNFNDHWREWPGYRDIVKGGVAARYSVEQQKYFETPPKQRFDLIESFITGVKLEEK